MNPAASVVTDNPPLGVANDLVQERLQAGQGVRFTIPTTSMSPFLKNGDSVVVRASRVEDAIIGDVVIVKLGGQMLAHRLIARRAEGEIVWTTTKGDNTPRADEPWTAAEAVGIVTTIRSNGRERDLRTRRARSMNRALAMLSLGQWSVYCLPSSALKSLVLFGFGIAVGAFGRLTRHLS